MVGRFVSLLTRKSNFRSVSNTLTRRNFRPIHNTSVLSQPIIPFKLADIGEGIAEVEVLQWFVKDGDQVKQFQNVCEVQSDKATVEITSRYDGVVNKVHYKVGEMAQVGSTLIDIEVDESVAVSAQEPKPKKSNTTIQKAKVNAREEVKVSRPSEVSTPISSNPLPQSSFSPSIKIATDGNKVLTSPSVRRLAKEHNIDLSTVPASGPAGRILKEDILEYIRAGAASVNKAPNNVNEHSAPQLEHNFDQSKNPQYLSSDETVALTSMQKMMVKSMNAALQIPHFGYADEVEMDGLYKMRLEMKSMVEQQGNKLSYMPFIIKAASLSLKYFPVLNSTVSECQTKLTMIANHNISVAMDTPTGLIVPNIKEVQNKSIFEIAAELNRLQKLASIGKLSPADLAGGTFSISNIGSVGGTYMSPVIMLPQVAIGAVGKIQTLPRFQNDGSVVPVRLMNVSWSGDHRVVDGATMARFSNQWKSYLENPVLMLSEMS